MPSGIPDGHVVTANAAADGGIEWAAQTGGSGIAETLLDAKGDLIVASAADVAARLPAGTDGQILESRASEATGLKWVAAGGGAVLLTTIDAKGDLLVGTAADTLARLAAGSDGQVLESRASESTGLKWVAAGGGGIADTIMDAKGDLIVATAADTPARLAAGTDGYVLESRASEATGLKWVAPSGGGGGGTGHMILVPIMQTVLDSPKWANSGTPVVRWLFIIPPDWDGSSDFSIKIFRRSSVSAGTSVMPRSTFRFRDATASNTLESNVAMSFTPGDTNTHLTTFTLAAASFAIGDTVRIDLARSSADGADTSTGFVDSDGGWVEYTKA